MPPALEPRQLTAVGVSDGARQAFGETPDGAQGTHPIESPLPRVENADSEDLL
jgi:hypothetical protein